MKKNALRKHHTVEEVLAAASILNDFRYCNDDRESYEAQEALVKEIAALAETGTNVSVKSHRAAMIAHYALTCR